MNFCLHSCNSKQEKKSLISDTRKSKITHHNSPILNTCMQQAMEICKSILLGSTLHIPKDFQKPFK